jgi:16S rRNA G966 N2-methylase RsmD
MLQKQKKRFDLIFADPPYDLGYITVTMEALVAHPVYHGHSCLIFEHSKREEVPREKEQGFGKNVRRYGDTFLSILVPDNGLTGDVSPDG